MPQGSWEGHSRYNTLARKYGEELAKRLSNPPSPSKLRLRIHKQHIRNGTHRRVDVPAHVRTHKDGTKFIIEAYWFAVPMRRKVERTDAEIEQLTKEQAMTTIAAKDSTQEEDTD